MNQRFYMLLPFLALFMVQSFGQTTINISDGDLEGNMTYNWTKDNIYVLDGLVYLEDGGILNIEAGTVIKGAIAPSNGDNTSALIITRDAQIFAEGTATEPIIFTAEIDDPSNPNDLPDPQEAQGLWGGLILLGHATIARPGGEDGIEGIDADEARAKFGGGNSPNDSDNSGTLRYVSIRHGGAPLSPGNEINGLSLGGVGSGTKLEYIEVFANFDDGIEFFGGTVDLKYASVSFCGDDSYDYDFGWKGRGQFWFSLQDDGPASVGRAGEHDGANPDGLDPFSQPTIYNATYIGSGTTGATPDGDGNDFTFVFRDRTGGYYWNSIFTDFYGKALTIEDLASDDNDTYANFLNGSLALKDNIWFGYGAGSELADLVQLGEDNAGADVSTLVSTLANDGNTLSDPTLAGISRTPDGGLDPRPNAGSPALAVENVPTDAFFSNVSYKGAFANNENWLTDWTALSGNGFLGDLVTPVVGQDILITDADLETGQTYSWSADNTYILDGLVYLEEGGTLNIEAGTVIKGAIAPSNGDNTSALIIARGAKINAIGTSDAPIIFTAQIDDPSDPNDVPDPQEAQGLWGGLILLGNATIARPGGEDGIEGIDADEARAKFGGGTTPDDNDNSGTLRYVSIRHGGAALSPGNEINGLSLGGVGSGTTLEYIEVFANFDDGIEFFGGTVDLKYASVSFCGDDSYDYDFGWKGRGQFWFSLQDDGPASVGRAGEHDGANPDGLNPFSQPSIYNATYIGSGTTGATPDGDGNDFTFVFRDRAGGFYWNSVFTDFYDKALTIEDLSGDNNDTYTNFQNGDLALKNNIWFGYGAGTELADLVQLGEDNAGADVSALVSTLVNDGNTLADPALAGISRIPDGGLDPRLNAGSPALGIEEVPTDPFFTNVGYKGAFGNDSNWLLGWSALDDNGFIGDLVTEVSSETFVIKDEDLVANETYSWTANNTYILDGLVYLEAGGKLNIEAGTVIKGAIAPSNGDNTSALIIAKDAQIFAVGTAEAPIIFTAEIDDPFNANDVPDPQEAQGLWGGLILLGNATIARPGGEDGIEGIDADEVRAKFGGGTTPDDNDNSGILRYVSIRHGGAALSPGNEINGLSLGGVGSGTTLEYIEVFANFDDGIEFFGGTVDLKYASVSFCGDDSYDYDFGWKGRGQFWFSLQDDGPASVGRAGEHDGANPDGLNPFSQPSIYNATYIGSGATGATPDGDGNDFTFVFRDRAGGFYWNSVFTDFSGKALTIEDLPNDDNDTYTNFQNGDLAFKNNIWFGYGDATDLAGLVQLGEDNAAGDVTALVTTLVTDGNQLVDPLLGGISRVGDNGLDPRPTPESPARSGATAPSDEYFTTVDYLGAFDPDANLWLKRWTALDVNQFLGDVVSSTYERVREEKGITFEAPVPTPANDWAMIKMSLVDATKVNMYVVDLNGRVIRQEMNNQFFGAGDHQHTIDVTRLATGTYFVVLQADRTQIVHKLIIAR